MTEKIPAAVAELIEIVREFKGADFVGPETAAGNLNFLVDLGLDSLEMINLLFQIEQKYGIQITDEDMKRNDLTVVGNMAAFIAKRK